MSDRLVEFALLWLYRLLDAHPLLWAMFGATVVAVLLARRRFDEACAAGARVASIRLATGAAAAREILQLTDLDDVGIQRARGLFEDDYDIGCHVLRLSDFVHDASSVTAVALAAEAAGHALQDRRREAPVMLLARDAALIACRLAFPTAALLFGVGLVLDLRLLMNLGLLVPALTAVLPLGLALLEEDAAHRARRALAMATLIDSTQSGLADRIIRAALWRMVASVIPRLSPPAWRRLQPDPPHPAAWVNSA